MGADRTSPSVRARISEQHAQLIPAGGSIILCSHSVILSSIKLIKHSSTTKLGTVSRPSQPRHLTLGQWRSDTATHPHLGRFTPRSQVHPVGCSSPCPFKGAEPGSATSAPKQQGASAEARAGESAARVLLIKMATPWPPRSRPTVTSLPGRRRLSGAVRDKQKEAPEQRCGRRRDGAAGAWGCLPGGRARRAQVSGRGGERGASCHLSKPTYTRPRPAARPGAPGASGALSPGRPPGDLPRCSAYLWAPQCPESPGHHPLAGSAAREPPPRHPCASLCFRNQEFPPRLPHVPLSSPGSPQILTPPHTLSRS